MCPMPFEHYKIQKVLIMKEENKKKLIRLKIEVAFRTWSFPLAQSLITRFNHDMNNKNTIKIN
jgi:hypothetical protein